MGDTGVFAQAMMNRGHKAGADPEVDPYVEDVLWMIHWLLTQTARQAIPAGNVGGAGTGWSSSRTDDCGVTQSLYCFEQ